MNMIIIRTLLNILWGLDRHGLTRSNVTHLSLGRIDYDIIAFVLIAFVLKLIRLYIFQAEISRLPMLHKGSEI